LPPLGPLSHTFLDAFIALALEQQRLWPSQLDDYFLSFFSKFFRTSQMPPFIAMDGGDIIYKDQSGFS